MERIGINGMQCALLSMFLFLLLCPSVFPARIEEPTGSVCFYWYPWYCIGLRACCSKLKKRECCHEDFGPSYGCSADVTPPTTEDFSYIFEGYSCKGVYNENVGYQCRVGRCFIFAAGSWDAANYALGNQPSELASGKSCNRTVYPDSLEYTFITDDRRRAHWVLPKVNISKTELLNVTGLSNEQQVDWFQSRGATLKVDEHEMDPADQPEDPSMHACSICGQ